MARHDIRDWKATQTEEQLRAVASSGGKATQEKNRRYRTFKECMKDILSLDVTDDQLKKKLVELGLDPTFSNAISLSSIQKAAALGDIEAARFARDTVGEKPTEALQMAITDKPIKSLDLSQLSDDELEALADGLE